jgi:repressor of nif and glnA expression
MGKFKIKRPSKGYQMTSLNFTSEDRKILAKIMKERGCRMGEAVRYALRELKEKGSASL